MGKKDIISIGELSVIAIRQVESFISDFDSLMEQALDIFAWPQFKRGIIYHDDTYKQHSVWIVEESDDFKSLENIKFYYDSIGLTNLRMVITEKISDTIKGEFCLCFFDYVPDDLSYYLKKTREIREKIELAKEAISNNLFKDIAENTYSLLDISEDIGYLESTMVKEFQLWTDTINVENIDLLYCPTKSEIIIPELIEANETLIDYIAKNPEKIYEIPWRKFEEIIAEIFSEFGFYTELTAKTQDGGRDIIAIQNHNNIQTKYIIECKKYAKNRKVGISLVRQLLGVKISEKANKALLVTTSSFTRGSIEFQKQNFWDLQLKDYNAVMEWIREYSRKRQK